MVHGQCLCGSIEFSAQEIPGMVFNCHCNRCQKSHGAGYSTQVVCDPSSLSFKKGKEHLKEYSVPTAVRAFCGNCGSRLMNYSNDKISYLSISLSVVEEKSKMQPVGECYVGQRLEHTLLNENIAHFNKIPEI